MSSAMLALAVACGKSSNSGAESRETTPDAGENGAGGSVSSGGSGARAGTAGASRGGANVGGEAAEGGEPADGGAPIGGSAGAATGGVSGGGSSNAGASTAGAAGSGGVRLPDGCEAGAQLVSAAYCSAAMTCGARRLDVSCSEDAGAWSCSCTDARNRVDYQFPSARGVTTCETAAKACVDPELLTGPETCERTRAEGAGTCSIRDDCTRSHVIDGVTLLTRTERNSSCRSCDDPQPRTCCRCADRLAVDYRLRDVDLAEACDFIGELCKPDGFDPVGAKTCEPTSEMTYPDNCLMEVSCTEPIELADGTRLSTHETFDTWCGPRYPDERMICSCRNGAAATVLTLDPGSAQANMGLCTAATAACAGAESIVPTAGPSCSSTVSVMQNACSIDGDCAQPATIGGIGVTVLTNVNVQCELQVDGSWLCFCTRAGSTLEVEADGSDSACQKAAAECPTTSPVF